MRTKLILFYLCNTILLINADCQFQYKPGYIIGISGDTTRLNINTEMSDRCMVQYKDRIKEYFPKDILAFEMSGNRFFSSQILADTFVEVLVKGEMNLYKVNTVYLMQKTDGTLFKFENRGNIKVERGDKEFLMKDNKWKGLIKFLMSDCMDANDKLNGIDFIEKDFVSLVVTYNKCKNSTYTVYKTKVAWLSFRTGIGVGYSIASLKLNTKETDNTFPSSFKTTILFPYVSFEMYPSRSTSKNSLLIEAQYQPFKTSSIKTTEYTIFNRMVTTHINFNRLSLPILLSQRLINGKIGLYLNGGINFDFILNQSSQVLNTDTYSTTPVLIKKGENNQAYIFNFFQTGAIAGL